MKIDWKKLWKEFDKWADGKAIYPSWYGRHGQKVKIRELVEAQLKKRRTRSMVGP